MLLVLELCANGNLLNYISKEGANHPTEHLLDILRDIASGMRHLHTKHFVHRDLAARNVRGLSISVHSTRVFLTPSLDAQMRKHLNHLHSC